MTFKSFFHILSYLQYPLMLMALFMAFKPFIFEFDQIKGNVDLVFKNFNSVLVFMGLGISFSSLQDTNKTQNELSRKIWEDPVKGKIMIVIMCLMILITLVAGLIGHFSTQDGIVKNLATGLIVLGLGMFGILKAAVEMFENHRKDKNP